MAHLAQFVSAWDGSDLAQFAPAWVEDSTAIILVTDIDAGNVSATSTVITDPTSSEPVINLAHRPDAGNWRHLLFALDDADGKRPIFKAPRATRYTNADPSSEYRPVWTQDFQTWNRAPSRQLVGGSTGTIEWQFSGPFPPGRVYVATQPLARQIDATYFAQELLSNYSSVCFPAAASDSQGVFFTSPEENDGTGRPVGGHPMYGLSLRFGGSTTDGNQKRKIVMIAGLHAAGEQTSWWPFVACVRWMLDSAEAADFRANWDVDFYFNITPNGVYGGSNRRNFRSGVDPNRIWDAPNAEVAATQAAILAGVSDGRFDAYYSWHAWSGATGPFLCYVTPTQESPATRRPIMQAMIDTAASVFGTSSSITSSGTYNTDVWWAEQQGAAVVFNTEVQQNGSTDPAFYQMVGESWAKTLQAVDAAGYFDPVTHELSAEPSSVSIAASNATLTHVRRFALSADPSSYAVTAADATLTYVQARTLSADPASYTLTAADATLKYVRKITLAADPASISVSAADATLAHATPNRALVAEPAAIVITPENASLLLDRRLSAEPTTNSITPSNATLVRGRALNAEPTSYTVGSFDATLIYSTPHKVLAADASSIVLSPADAGLVAGRKLIAEPFSVSVTPRDAQFARGRALIAEPSGYSISASDATLFVATTDRVLPADAASYSLTAAPAALLWSGASTPYLNRSVFVRIGEQAPFVRVATDSAFTRTQEPRIFTRVQ